MLEAILMLAGWAFSAALFMAGYVKKNRNMMLVAFALMPFFTLIDPFSQGAFEGAISGATDIEWDPVKPDEVLSSLPQEKMMQVDYLEIVTPDVDAVCATYAATHEVEFSEPDAGLGLARTASLHGGGLVGVRAPLRETEEPIVRPYWLVDDIEAAVAAVAESGAQVAIPPMEIPGHGTFAIYIEGGVEHGLWQR